MRNSDECFRISPKLKKSNANSFFIGRLSYVNSRQVPITMLSEFDFLSYFLLCSGGGGGREITDIKILSIPHRSQLISMEQLYFVYQELS